MHGRTIGVLSPLLAGSYFGAVISAINRFMAETGGQAVAVQTLDFANGDTYRATPEGPARIGWHDLAGFVVVINAVPLEYLAALRAAGKPVVLISRDEAEFPCPVVLPDNFNGVREAVKHLLAHGHRRIAFAGDVRQYDIRERYGAYRAALLEHGIEPVDELFYPTSDNLESGGRDAAAGMMAAGLPSTAVMAATDYNAMGIMAALAEAGYVLPRDQAIVGFDDMPESRGLSPALSSVSTHFDLIGAKAADLLVRQLNGEDIAPGHYVVAASYIQRESCGCSEVLAAASVIAAGGDPQEGFVPGLCGLIWPGPDAGELAPSAAREHVAQVGAEIRALFEAALLREVTSAELLTLSRLSQELYTFAPSVGTYVRILALTRRLARATEAKATAPEIVARIDLCMHAVGAGLSKARLAEQAHLGKEEHELMAKDSYVSLALLNSQESDPRSLRWLAQSTASEGILALWSDDAGSPARLRVVGTFDARDGTFGLPPTEYAPESFPPAMLVARARQQPGAMCFVMPIRSTATDWGFLAVVGPTGTSFTGRATYYQWSALLSLALEHQATTESLRRRTEDLATSFEREREMAQAVRESEERYALAARAANDGLWDWDITTETVYYSTRWKQLLGYRDASIGTSPEEWLGRVHPDDRAGLLNLIAEQLEGSRNAFEHEHRLKAADGYYRWVLCRGLGVPGAGRAAARLVGSLTDITDRHSLQEQLRHQALHDNLTGLPNRVLFLDRLSQAIAQSRRRPGYVYAVLWLDLDGFKVVNDSRGHLVGDMLLKKVAERLARLIRGADTAARFGGDEFAVLLHDAPNLEAVEKAVKRFQRHLSKPYDLDGLQVTVTASIGISTSASGYDNAEDVLRDADIAMYRAKASGRGSYAAFSVPCTTTATPSISSTGASWPS